MSREGSDLDILARVDRVSGGTAALHDLVDVDPLPRQTAPSAGVGARAQVAVSGGGFPHRTRGHTVFLGWRGDREMRRAERGAARGNATGREGLEMKRLASELSTTVICVRNTLSLERSAFLTLPPQRSLFQQRWRAEDLHLRQRDGTPPLPTPTPLLPPLRC
jgi:hypothetical protein